MPMPAEPLLLDVSEAAASLMISPEDLDWLAATRQLLPIMICGKRRFLQSDLRNLARVYQSTQNRG